MYYLCSPLGEEEFPRVKLIIQNFCCFLSLHEIQNTNTACLNKYNHKKSFLAILTGTTLKKVSVKKNLKKEFEELVSKHFY
jgi:hypothetical protein